MNSRWKTGNHCIFNVCYHVIWCPKYRRNVLVNDVKDRLLELLREKSKVLDVSIDSIEIMPDHLHMFIKAKPTHPVHFVIGQMKGFSSRILRSEFPHLRKRLPSLWTRSYYVETIGHISEKTIKKYIEDQKKV